MERKVSEQTSELMSLLCEAKDLARRYYDLTGRPLGCTGEIAEFEAVRILGLELAPVRQSGYDATRGAGEGIERIQIKGRHMPDGAKLSRKIGKIDCSNVQWDVVILVLLDDHFDAKVMYEAQRRDVVAALQAPGSRARNERGQLSISKFKSISQETWRRQDL